MACFTVTLKELSSNICSSFQEDLKIVLDSWGEMGLSDAQVKERQQTVIKQISDVTKIMVKEEKRHKDKLTKICDDHYDQITELWSELECEGEFGMEQECEGFSLLKKENYLRKQLDLFQKEKDGRLEEEKGLIKENYDLSSFLGVECVKVAESTLLTGRKQIEIENHNEELKRMKEERENRMMNMQEEIFSLVDQLEIDISEESLTDSVLFDIPKRLRITDLLTVQESLDKLKKQLVDRQKNSELLVKEIVHLYDKLNVPSSQRLPLAMGQVCCMEDLYKSEYLSQLEDELKVMMIEKKKNMKTLVENAKVELNEMWQKCFISEEDRGVFERRCAASTDDTLDQIEDEINKLTIYYDHNYEMLTKYKKLMALWNSVEELETKSRDPNRLFKSRGNALFKEEKERKQVGQKLPKIEHELKMLAEEQLVESGQVLSIGRVPLVDIIENLRIIHSNQLKNISLDVKVSNNSNQSTLKLTTLNNNKSTRTNSFNGTLKQTPTVMNSFKGVLKQTPTVMNSPVWYQKSSISKSLHRPNAHRAYSPSRPRAPIPKIQVIESTPKDLGFPGASSTFIGSDMVEKPSDIFGESSVLHSESPQNSLMGRRYSTVNHDDSTLFLLQDSFSSSVVGTNHETIGIKRKGAISSKFDVAGKKKKFGFSFKQARLGEHCAAGRRTSRLNSLLSSASSRELANKIMTSNSTVI